MHGLITYTCIRISSTVLIDAMITSGEKNSEHKRIMFQCYNVVYHAVHDHTTSVQHVFVNFAMNIRILYDVNASGVYEYQCILY
jgi:hypothetical protein